MGLKDLPLASGLKHQRAFEQLGWVVRNSGNHIVMTHRDHVLSISIPNHKEVNRGTLHSIIRATGLTDKQYRDLFTKL